VGFSLTESTDNRTFKLILARDLMNLRRGVAKN